jgi:hypothetical protein
MNESNAEDLEHRKFWCAMIALAVEDARGRNIPEPGPQPKERRLGGRPAIKRATPRQTACHWLAERGGMFERVCAVMGLDHELIRAKALA